MATTGWILTVLALLTAPQTAGNVLALTLWAQSEGLPDWYNNWLATFREDFGWAPARTGYSPPYYPQRRDGIAATVLTIKQPNMATIWNALRSGLQVPEIFQAINRSPWCLGCQTGHYPIALYDAVIAGGAAVTPGQVGVAPPPVVGPTGTPAGEILYLFFQTLTNWVQDFSAQIFNTMLYIESAAAPLNN